MMLRVGLASSFDRMDVEHHETIIVAWHDEGIEDIPLKIVLDDLIRPLSCRAGNRPIRIERILVSDEDAFAHLDDGIRFRRSGGTQGEHRNGGVRLSDGD
jgi:hypothetical protein